MRQKVLVVGGGGMLGHKLVHVLARERALEVHATVRSLPPEAFRAADAQYHEGVEVAYGSNRLAGVIDAVQPAVILNAVGAIKQKDLAAAPDETFYLNGVVPFALAASGARVIHFSTDCVFRGDRGQYSEDDLPDATDVYGLSKACGELRHARHLTIRTSIVGFEFGGHLGLLSWLLKQPRGSRLHGYRGATFSGLPTVTLSRLVRHLIVSRGDLSGLFHVASEPISKHELVLRLNHALDLGHIVVPVDEPRIDRSLDDRKFRERTGLPRPGWDELIADLVADFESLPYRSVYESLRTAAGVMP